MREKQELPCSMRSGKLCACRARGLPRELHKDDDILAHLDALLDRRLGFPLFRQPFGSHGAAQPRSEQQPPWFLRAEKNQMIQRLRVSAAGSLDAVVPG